MNPWNWNNDRNLWLNNTTGETMTVEEWDDVRCKYIAQLEAKNKQLRQAIKPLAYVKRARRVFADNSIPLYVVTEYSKRNAQKALGGE